MKKIIIVLDLISIVLFALSFILFLGGYVMNGFKFQMLICSVSGFAIVTLMQYITGKLEKVKQ